MLGIGDVYSGYVQTAASLKRVPGAQSTPALGALKGSLPAYLLQQIGETGRDPEAFRCYGGYGEPNRTFAKVPWVAACKRSVARKVQEGYFIVLLFREDMAGCWLSLNQGYTQYQAAFVNDDMARRQSQVGARLLTRLIDIPAGFVEGPIDLVATTNLGRGYEAGAIVSRYYAAPDEPTEAAFSADFRRLLEILDRLESKVGPNLVALLPDAEGPYQAAATELAKKSSKELPAIPSGPLPPQGKLSTTNKGGYRRDPRMAAEALSNAQFTCEWNGSHATFTARRTGQNFVEAHHLIPMAEQVNHSSSLDVPENIVALCPTCHRLVHHGRAAERTSIAAKLLERRTAGLAARGIVMSEAAIRQLYRTELEDD